MPVSEGDTILVLVSNLDNKKEHPIYVTWSQQFSNKTETYIQTSFTITNSKNGGKTGAETEAIIFVQLNMLDAFRNKKLAGHQDFTIVVDKDFQYGQKSKDGTGRWLAYHDKKHTPYQHRFITSAIQSAAGTAAYIASKLGFPTADVVLKEAASLFGDYLHNF